MQITKAGDPTSPRDVPAENLFFWLGRGWVLAVGTGTPGQLPSSETYVKTLAVVGGHLIATDNHNVATDLGVLGGGGSGGGSWDTEATQDVLAAVLAQQGWTYDDTANTFTPPMAFDPTGAAASEAFQDFLGPILTQAGWTYNDAANTFTPPATSGGSGTPADGSITEAKLATGSVSARAIADGVIGDAEIAVGRALLGGTGAAAYVQDIVGPMSADWAYNSSTKKITLPAAVLNDQVHVPIVVLQDFDGTASVATKIATVKNNSRWIAGYLVNNPGKRVVVPPCPSNKAGWPAAVVIDEQLGTYEAPNGVATTIPLGQSYALSGPLREVPGTLTSSTDTDPTHIAAAPVLSITRKAGPAFTPVNLRNTFQLGPQNPNTGSVFTKLQSGFELASGYAAHRAGELIDLTSKNVYGYSARAGYTAVYKGVFFPVAGICVNITGLSYTALNTALGLPVTGPPAQPALSSIERRTIVGATSGVTALVQGDIAGTTQVVVNSMSGDFTAGEAINDQATGAQLGTFALATIFMDGLLDAAYDDTPTGRVVSRSSVALGGLVVDTDGDIDAYLNGYNRPSAVYLAGCTDVKLENARIKGGYNDGILLRSCWDITGDVDISHLANHAIETAIKEQAYGYGVRLLGHTDNFAIKINGDDLRHVETTNAIGGSWNLNRFTGSTTGSADLCTNHWNHGPGGINGVFTGEARGTKGTGWDMHEGATNIVFMRPVVVNPNSAARSTSSPDGLTIRGFDITVIDPWFIGVRVGINDQSGPLDSDGRQFTNRVIGGFIEAQLYAWAQTEDAYKEALARYRLKDVTLRCDPAVTTATQGQACIYARRSNIITDGVTLEGSNDRMVRHTSYVDPNGSGSDATGHVLHRNVLVDFSDAAASRVFSQEATWARIAVRGADAFVNPVSGTQKPFWWFTQQAGDSAIFHRDLYAHPITGTAVPTRDTVASGGTGTPTYTRLVDLGETAGAAAVSPFVYLSTDVDVAAPTASSTVSDMPGFQATLQPGIYEVRAMLLYTSTASGAGSFRFGLGGAGSAGASITNVVVDQQTSTTAKNLGILNVLATAGTTGSTTAGSANTYGLSSAVATPLPIFIEGKLTVTTAGVLGLMWQLTSGATATCVLKAGSTLKMTKVA